MGNEKKRQMKRSPSLESTASAIMTGSNVRSSAGSTIDEGGYDLPGEIYNCATALIHCTKHQRFGLQKISKNKGFFLPVVAVFPSEESERTMKARLRQLLAAPDLKTKKGYVPFGELEHLHLLRVQIPVLDQHVERRAFYVRLPVEDDLCCQHAPKLTWASLAEVNDKNNEHIWGPEVQVFVEAFCSGNSQTDFGQMTEISLREARRHIPKTEQQGKSTVLSALVKGAGYSEHDVMRMYGDFTQHCWPSQYMNLTSFDSYMTEIKFYPDDSAKKESRHYFRAFAADLGWISFEEFLLGFAATDNKTPHGGNTGELRCNYIFKFYDFNDNKKLEYSEVSRLTFDSMRNKKDQQLDPAALEAHVTQTFAALKISKTSSINLIKFKEAVGALLFRGTSNVFRSPVSFRKASSQQFIYPVIDDSYTSIDDIMSGGRNSSRIKCSQCKQKRYALASHAITITTVGFQIDPLPVDEEDVKRQSRVQRSQSNEYFMQTIPNLCIDLIREHAEATNIVPIGHVGKSKGKCITYLASNDKKGYCDKFLQICDMVEAIFKKEERVLKLQAPIHVFGDTHGNLHDLLLYERLLWKEGLKMTAGSFLFLGDYVDRGPQSLEVVLYLFAHKIIAPGKMFLLRGNHELRSTNRSFTFYKELEEKFGSQMPGTDRTMGSILWERFNQVFDTMPVCAVIDESIFCAHGGIPTSLTNIKDLAGMPCPLSDPESQYPAAWEMLWNDPINAQEYNDYLNLLRAQTGSNSASGLQSNGFIPNTKRGTAYYFSEDAVRSFFQKNGLSHVIRAHEVCQNGFQFHHRGRVMTVFSSSKYGNGLNESAYVLVKQSKLRSIKFNTTY